MEWGVTVGLSYRDFEEAWDRIKGVVHHTPLIYSRTFSGMTGNDIFLKAENLQKTGSFKVRGAYNKLSQMKDEERNRGVVAASAGNHAQGVAYAASLLGIKSMVVMPETTPVAKVEATRNYGAEIVLCGSCYDDACRKAQEIQAQTGMPLIHAFNDLDIIAGQGTIALEILQDNPDVDMMVVPMGGGGLISGIASAAKHIKPDVSIIGVESSGFEAIKKSVEQGVIISSGTTCVIADGIAVKTPGDITYPIIKSKVDDIVIVTEDEISATILMLMERAKLVAEGAGASALAAAVFDKISLKGKKAAVLLSGGNIDINLISAIISKGLIKSGRRVELKTVILDKPGQLKSLLEVLSEANVNIISISHNREHESVGIGYAEVVVTFETYDRHGINEITALLKSRGYRVGD